MYVNVYVGLFIITKTCKQPKCPSVGEWINYLSYMYTMEYYLAVKRMNYQYAKQHGWISDALCHVKETTQKATYYVTVFTQYSGKGKNIWIGNRPNDCQGLMTVGRGWLQRSMRKLLRAAAMFCILIVGWW